MLQSGLIAQPAAGGTFTVVLSNVQPVKLYALYGTYTTVVGGSARGPQFFLLDLEGTPVFQVGNLGVLTPGNAANYGITPAVMNYITLALNSGQNGQWMPWPAPAIPPGWSIQAQVAAASASDQWSNLTYIAEFDETLETEAFDVIVIGPRS